MEAAEVSSNFLSALLTVSLEHHIASFSEVDVKNNELTPLLVDSRCLLIRFVLRHTRLIAVGDLCTCLNLVGKASILLLNLIVVILRFSQSLRLLLREVLVCARTRQIRVSTNLSLLLKFPWTFLRCRRNKLLLWRLLRSLWRELFGKSCWLLRLKLTCKFVAMDLLREALALSHELLVRNLFVSDSILFDLPFRESFLDFLVLYMQEAVSRANSPPILSSLLVD